MTNESEPIERDVTILRLFIMLIVVVVIISFFVLVIFSITDVRMLSIESYQMVNYCNDKNNLSGVLMYSPDGYYDDRFRLDENIASLTIKAISSVILLNDAAIDIKIDCGSEIINATATVRTTHSSSVDKWGDKKYHTSHITRINNKK